MGKDNQGRQHQGRMTGEIFRNTVPRTARGTVDEIGGAIQTLVHEHVSIVIVLGAALFVNARRRIAAFALASRLPTVFNFREHVEDGGLISYGIDLRQNFRRAAYFVDRILKGAKPPCLWSEWTHSVRQR
jgi:putative ABC transport system substrate-binding protein